MASLSEILPGKVADQNYNSQRSSPTSRFPLLSAPDSRFVSSDTSQSKKMDERTRILVIIGTILPPIDGSARNGLLWMQCRHFFVRTQEGIGVYPKRSTTSDLAYVGNIQQYTSVLLGRLLSVASDRNEPLREMREKNRWDQKPNVVKQVGACVRKYPHRFLGSAGAWKVGGMLSESSRKDKRSSPLRLEGPDFVALPFAGLTKSRRGSMRWLAQDLQGFLIRAP
ncbi:hypothetical protein BKA70DRAFT_1237725 [Coprinopsis sp. MPI-PUGE-AT-0042]|nr:hypothetical protein BKA70DRAFT_1237725 [Coprinopsis sp. MPI-PUGE-AT-0042]